MVEGLLLSGAFGLRVNTTDTPLTRTVRIGGTDVALAFGAGEEKLVRFAGQNVTLATKLGEVSGGVVFAENLATQQILGAGDNIHIFVGDFGEAGAADDVGVRVDDGAFAFLLEPAGTYAFEVRGAVNVVGLESQLQFAGNLTAETNTTGADVNLGGIDPDGNGPLAARSLNVPAGVTRFGADDVTLNVGGGAFSLRGSFAVEKSTFGPDNLPGTADDATEIFVGASGVDLFVGDSASGKGVQVTGAELALLITGSNDYALEASGRAQVLGIPGVSLTGTIGAERNTRTTAVARKFTVGGKTKSLSVAAAASATTPFSRIGGEAVELGVRGQTLTGNFTLTDTGTDIAVTVAGGTLDFGGGLLAIEEISAAFTIQPAGVVGTFSAGLVQFSVPGAAFSGAVSVSLDTTVPAPFFRIAGTGLNLTIAGQTLSGNFTFEERSGVSATGRVLEVSADTISLTLQGDSGPFVSLTGASGQLLVTAQGIAGQVSVPSATVTVPTLFSGTFAVSVQCSSLPTAVTATFGTRGLTLPSGPFLRVEVVAAPAGAITVAGGQLSGSSCSSNEPCRDRMAAWRRPRQRDGALHRAGGHPRHLAGRHPARVD